MAINPAPFIMGEQLVQYRPGDTVPATGNYYVMARGLCITTVHLTAFRVFNEHPSMSITYQPER